MNVRGPLFVASLAIAASSSLGASTGCANDEGASTSESDVRVAPSPFWKDRLSFPNEPFAAFGGTDQPRWVKFTIFTSDPTKVYFQDSNAYAFHYDFAKAHLPGYEKTSAADYGRVTLKAEGQKLITGSVLMPPRRETMELGIQLIREDEYSKEEVKRLHDLVRSKIDVEGKATVRAFYMPTFELSAAAARDAAWLLQERVEVGSADRWLSGDACYASGWAFGRAKLIPSAEIQAAYHDGRLTFDDILVTDGVPAEVPYVAGIVSLSPSTPSSHVAILSKTWGTPFVFPVAEASREALRKLGAAGKEIALRTTGAFDSFGNASCTLDVIEPKGTIDAATRAKLAELRRPAPAEVPVKTRLGALTKSTATLTPADVKFFGGKAANFGTLRRAIPESSPNALGISFDLWDAFLGQTLPSGKTLKQEIDARIGGLSFPPAMTDLEAKLEEIRALIDAATLPPSERTKLFAELRAFGFDPKIKIRFRSSTNVEDGAVLSGAGLYDSYSGCLADDLDGDDAGPSACDPGEAKEKGAERAIKKVFASFFNTNAVLERLKYRIPEESVGMALAVHHSFPDATEAANGVATVRLAFGSTAIDLVTQLGAESVTNPTGGSLPESVNVQAYGPKDEDIFLTLRQGSSLVQLGGKVMTWEADYRDLARLIQRASEAFKTDHAFTGDELAIDIEYKKDTSGKLTLKQIRQIPERSRMPSVVPVLLNEAPRLCTFQGEFGDVLANHRLKTQGVLEARSTELSDAAVRTSLVSNIDFDAVENGVHVQRRGRPATFDNARHEVNAELVRDAWSVPFGTLILDATTRRLVAPSESPLAFARDFAWFVRAKYTAPRSSITWEGIKDVSEDETRLRPCATDIETSPQVQTVEAQGPRGLSVTTRFHYFKGGAFDKTAELATWESTEIRGLTSLPITLKGWYSQTFRPQHHNFTEDFVFEPGLEEGLPAAIAQELAAKDIQAIVVKDATQGPAQVTKIYVLRRSTQKLELFE